nr:unnamed protein product [Digitaria exilis]
MQTAVLKGADDAFVPSFASRAASEIRSLQWAGGEGGGDRQRRASMPSPLRWRSSRWATRRGPRIPAAQRRHLDLVASTAQPT